ncbi:uncharacterized protein BDR25DRAFT_69388 [Lindgomyces ingoldianus]|uniref:Uncharacterized protein n=1 Tax=Lindgomyces ingoldianus TaxID=673940 RepID=A0ACB6QJV0_9PLEO|nr:uncharacterized protein BDR25DRAFT_69388 [Lindgomyces ingoldianus]KAF2467175.1 hypothetical protein BDR25DRAFT_69388 [Lindgomyces ingoldianus]
MTQAAPVVQKFQELAASQIVSETAFSQQHDVSIKSLDALVNLPPSAYPYHLTRVDSSHIASTKYFKLVEDAVQELLVSGQNSVVPVDLCSEKLPGIPPKWLITKMLDEVLGKEVDKSCWRLAVYENAISCIPKEYEVQRRSTELGQLRDGKVPWINLQNLFEEIRGLQHSLKDLQDYANQIPEICVQDATAISNPWLSRLQNDCLRALEEDHYIDVMARVNDSFPAECKSKIFTELQSTIVDACNGAFPDMSPPHTFDTFILTSRGYNINRDLLLNSANLHAQNEWQGLQGHHDKEPHFRMSQILNLSDGPKPILALMCEDKKISKAIKERFWSEISNLESANEAEFRDFWARHVDGRTQNYADALAAIDDPKLRDELLNVVSRYVQKDLLPDWISMARSRGLVRSPSVRRRIHGLERTSQKDEVKIRDLVSPTDPTLVEQSKQALVSDLARKMEKLSDGLRLFLILVLILLAEHKPGVVYATAKFAPRLLKQLKSSLDVEQYEQLQEWKDQVKAGKLSPGDIASMKRLAAAAAGNHS